MLRKSMMMLLAVGLVTTIASLGFSVTTGYFEIWVTPTFTYDITVDSYGAAMNFGSVIPNEVRVSTDSRVNFSSVTVTNVGNATCDLQVKLENLSTWESSGNAKGDVCPKDVCMIAMVVTSGTFNPNVIQEASFPAAATSCILDSIGTAYQNCDSTHFVCSGGVDKVDNGNDITQGSKRALYFRFKAPSDTSDNTQQKFKMSVQALKASTF